MRDETIFLLLFILSSFLMNCSSVILFFMKASIDQNFSRSVASRRSLAFVFYVIEDVYLHSFVFFLCVFIKTNSFSFQAQNIDNGLLKKLKVLQYRKFQNLCAD